MNEVEHVDSREEIRSGNLDMANGRAVPDENLGRIREACASIEAKVYVFWIDRKMDKAILPAIRETKTDGDRLRGIPDKLVRGRE